MYELKTLIDKAVKVCGSVDALAVRMGVKPNVISMLRNGRTITPETAAELAEIAGLDARQAAILAIIERAKGTRREGAMREILGKGLAAGLAAMLVFSYAMELNSSSGEPSAGIKQLTPLYIVKDRMERFMRHVQQLLSIALRCVWQAWRDVSWSSGPFSTTSNV